MHQTKKGNQWYFGMKAHIGVDSRTKLIHSVAATAANVHDSQALPGCDEFATGIYWKARNGMEKHRTTRMHNMLVLQEKVGKPCNSEHLSKSTDLNF